MKGKQKETGHCLPTSTGISTRSEKQGRSGAMVDGRASLFSWTPQLPPLSPLQTVFRKS